ncbi:NADH:ubiquinone oxidoreductase 11.6kD subunit [Seiridium cupressi]|uniref:NADH dehydrogenase [ubiquinone] 1 beta subcomplex subunit 11, mitochondrial n=1 Tax=Seiridium unicorne TaxID=138068 RepID=A0ABR2VHM3_9PEZI
MPAVRPQAAVRASRALTSSQSTAATRSFSATATQKASHGPQYDPPSGWLFGVKPGEKYQNEGWEKPFFYGFCGSIALAAIAYGFKPDTSIQTWALEEARRRLEVEGILEDPEKK